MCAKMLFKIGDGRGPIFIVNFVWILSSFPFSRFSTHGFFLDVNVWRFRSIMTLGQMTLFANLNKFCSLLDAAPNSVDEFFCYPFCSELRRNKKLKLSREREKNVSVLSPFPLMTRRRKPQACWKNEIGSSEKAKPR